MEMNVIKCPNCGASSTNHTNCEYCGSLLVRFVDKGIDLSTTSYLTNDFVYEGLVEALKHNLERQELNSSKFVATDICYKSSETVRLSKKRHGVVAVERTGSAHWNDGDSIKLGEGEMGLVIKFSFDIAAEGEDVSSERIQKQYERFQKLSSLPLFTHHTSIYMRPGSSARFRCREYAIDFGQDSEGAARLISEVLDKVYEIPHDGKLICVSEDELKKAENLNAEKEQSQNEKEKLSGRKKIGLIATSVFMLFILLGSIVSGYIFSSLFALCSIVVLSCIFMRKINGGLTWPVVLGSLFLSLLILGASTDDESDAASDLQNDSLFYAIPKDGVAAFVVESKNLSGTALKDINKIVLSSQGVSGTAQLEGVDAKGKQMLFSGSYDRDAIYQDGVPQCFVQIRLNNQPDYPDLQILIKKDGNFCVINVKEKENVDGLNKLTPEYQEAFAKVFMLQTHGKLKPTSDTSIDTPSTIETKKSEVVTKEQSSQKDIIANEAFAAGVQDAREPESVATTKDLVRAGYTKRQIEDMQKMQGRHNYREDYGEPSTSEEQALMELYGEKYAEGFMKTMFK